MSNTEKICNNCKYFIRRTAGVMGTCHRFPPITGNKLHESMWCGEFVKDINRDVIQEIIADVQIQRATKNEVDLQRAGEEIRDNKQVSGREQGGNSRKVATPSEALLAEPHVIPKPKAVSRAVRRRK